MTLKSLLTTVVVASAAVSAYSFPTITVSPAPGKYDDVSYFETFNIKGTGVKVVEDAANKPYFESLDTGDVVNCSEFFNWSFMGSVTQMLKFDSSNFTENGEWELTLPAGCLIDADGNTNDVAYHFTYTLDDANLNIGAYPQITLVSSVPANGAMVPFWGESLGKVTFKTSDDSAVNYIGWTLYDITNGTGVNEREWMRQGSENRIDTNRTFGDSSDQWTNGLFISVGGVDEKLLEGHTYRLALQFCGIGYDPVTNQYPSPYQIQESLELETYIDFFGQAAATAYSYYTVEKVTPDPATYEFDDINMRTFTVYYTGHVKPTSFIYSLGQGAGTATAGTFSPASDANMNGYAEAWDFTISESVLKAALGQLMVTIRANDEDGLPVKGNGGYATDDFNYAIDWFANIGADRLTSVEPADGETVSRLGMVIIGNESNKSMFLAYTNEEPAKIVSMDREIIVELGTPTFSADEKTATWEFEAITKPGTYSLIIPKWYFNCGTETSSTTNVQTTFTYIIEGNEQPEDPETIYTLMPEKVSIEDGATLTTALDKVVVEFGSVAYNSISDPQPALLYREVVSMARANNYELVEEVSPVENDWWSPTAYTYTFATPVSENGNYQFVIPKGAFFDGTFDETDGKSGQATPQLVYNFSIDTNTGVEVITADTIVTVYDVAGRTVLRNAKAAAIRTLPAGVYVVNGKKVVVK